MPCPNCIKLEQKLDAALANNIRLQKAHVQERLADRFAAAGAHSIEADVLAEKHLEEMAFEPNGAFGYQGLRGDDAIRRLVTAVNLGEQLPSQTIGARLDRGELTRADLKPGSKALQDALNHGRPSRTAPTPEQLEKAAKFRGSLV
ncbi:MAG: hypothetical protein ACR2OG_08480 [Gemmatimonadaceae bacterium]